MNRRAESPGPEASGGELPEELARLGRRLAREAEALALRYPPPDPPELADVAGKDGRSHHGTGWVWGLGAAGIVAAVMTTALLVRPRDRQRPAASSAAVAGSGAKGESEAGLAAAGESELADDPMWVQLDAPTFEGMVDWWQWQGIPASSPAAGRAETRKRAELGEPSSLGVERVAL